MFNSSLRCTKYNSVVQIAPSNQLNYIDTSRKKEKTLMLIDIKLLELYDTHMGGIYLMDSFMTK